MDVCVLYIKRNKIRLKNKKKFTKESTLCAYVCYIKPVVKQECISCWCVFFFLFFLSDSTLLLFLLKNSLSAIEFRNSRGEQKKSIIYLICQCYSKFSCLVFLWSKLVCCSLLIFLFFYILFWLEQKSTKSVLCYLPILFKLDLNNLPLRMRCIMF